MAMVSSSRNGVHSGPIPGLRVVGFPDDPQSEPDGDEQARLREAIGRAVDVLGPREALDRLAFCGRYLWVAHALAGLVRP